MFDSVTAAVIASAPELSWVDHERLPELITEAHVEISVARALLGKDPADTESIFDKLRWIGAAQESIALTIDDRELQSSAAYVAASAYRILAEEFARAEQSRQLLQPNSIDPRVASVLLYLVADAAADASEVAADLTPSKDDPFGSLVRTLRRFGQGDVPGTFSGSEIVLDPYATPAVLGAAIGYRECEEAALEYLAFLGSTDVSREWELGRFATTAAAMSSDVTFGPVDDPHTTTSLIAGPWHLARLLDMAEPIVLRASAAAIATPPKVDESQWRKTLSRITRQRPLLWRNHRAALDAGLLQDGVSAVISFPTGAGKSTLSELKVSATVLRNKNVICLAPTLSLVDQLAQSFRRVAPEAKVTAQRDVDQDIHPTDDDRPEIFVMTPESCLAVLGLDYEQLGDVGLVLFDEAHLMHVDEGTPSRRALDATLCFLTLASRFPSADLLLVSAMISNANELAAWLESMTGRKAVALNSPWKPTRQARGALVYDNDEIERLRGRLAEAFHSSNTQQVPAAVRREMQAQAYGFFSLQSTWESKRKQDYRLTPLLNEPVQVGVGGKRSDHAGWWLTPNSNHVAASLARSSARFGVKTLVFTHQIGWTASIAREISSSSEMRISLKDDERILVKRIVDALGEQSALYLSVEDDQVVGTAIPHHGLLLPDERRLHEKLYQRADGVPVLVATSTVTQGMNFPSEFVIITSDRRFDPQTNSRARLEAHELLNAAGRAGRAGSHANALVLVVPGDIVGYDGSQIGSAWSPLRDTFSKSDQCVEVRDPVGTLLEELDSETTSPMLDYLLRRLDSMGDATIGPEMLHRSFAAYSARSSDDAEWVERRVAQLTEVIAAETAEPWVRQCSLISGLPLSDVTFVAAHLDTSLGERDTLAAWIQWGLELLRDRPSMAGEILRIGSRAALSGAPDELDDWSATDGGLVEHVGALLPLWLQGAPLSDIQQRGVDRGLAKDTDQPLLFARKFVLRVIPDLSYLFALPAMIQTQRSKLEIQEPLGNDHPLHYLGRCVELGVDSVEKVRLLESSRNLTRREIGSRM